MSWTRFKERHLFSLNLALVAGLILWKVRGDFTYHPLILVWLLLGFFLPTLRRAERALLHAVGKVNGLILLTLFYFLAFTPFSLIYRGFFRHQSFRKRASSFEVKESVSPFDRPF